MARVLYMSFALLVAIAGLAFYVRNKEPVELNFFFGSVTSELSVVMLGALLVGVLLGIVAMTSSHVKLRRELRRLARQKDIAGRELANLRAIAGNDAG